MTSDSHSFWFGFAYRGANNDFHTGAGFDTACMVTLPPPIRILQQVCLSDTATMQSYPDALLDEAAVFSNHCQFDKFAAGMVGRRVADHEPAQVIFMDGLHRPDKAFTGQIFSCSL